MISIVSAYHNRRDLLINTLKTINTTSGDVEYIVVDDCSSEEHRIEDLVEVFPFLKVIRLEKEDKWYVNPCVVFNKGFKEAKGDVIILQNPECLHVGDIIGKALQVKDDEYLSFGCYSIDQNKTKSISEHLINTTNVEETLLSVVEPNYSPVSSDGDNGWYNHSLLRPVGYHFCSSITRKNLEELGGFDERFAHGIAYDDNEILLRIRRKGLQIKIINKPFVVHQWHYTSHNYQHLNTTELINKNRDLLTVVSSETTWASNKN
jgi:GT2 family glycosyltransferase